MIPNYRPVGTFIRIKMLPPAETGSMVILPDGSSKPGQLMRFEIQAIGNEVNEEKFKLQVGEIALLGGGHPSEMMVLDKEAGIMIVDRRRVVAIEESNGTQN